jgi:hypothetical protein
MNLTYDSLLISSCYTLNLADFQDKLIFLVLKRINIASNTLPATERAVSEMASTPTSGCITVRAECAGSTKPGIAPCSQRADASLGESTLAARTPSTSHVVLVYRLGKAHQTSHRMWVRDLSREDSNKIASMQTDSRSRGHLAGTQDADREVGQRLKHGLSLAA